MKRIVKNWEIEFPTSVNGHATTSHGFLTPLHKHEIRLSQFFIRYNDGSIAYDMPEQVPAYVKAAVAKIARTI